MEQQYKRHVAYKLRIGDILGGKVNLENEKFKSLTLPEKEVVRVNVIANVVDKYIQDDEKKFGSITMDDGSGQLKIKTFGEDIEIFGNLEQGDTLLIIGMLRFWNNEVYMTPEIIKKKDPMYLLVRKFEVDKNKSKIPDKSLLNEVKSKIVTKTKESENNGGLDIDSLILDLKEPAEVINNEIKKLLEEGLVYEPRPGKLRWLGD